MPIDSIPPLSLGTAALVIFACCAGFVLLRGMTRMLIGTLILGLSAWLGFRVWQFAPALATDWTGKSLPWLTTGLPLASFLLSFFLLHKIAKILAKPFGNAGGPATPRSLPVKAVMLLFALIPTSLISLAGIALVHHTGSVAEMQAFSEKSRSTSPPAATHFSQRLKATLESALPAAWLTALAPFTQPSRLALAKLITTQPAPTLDPRTGKPIPRAVVVDDPELQALAREGNFSALLRHPRLTQALADPNIQKLLHDFRYRAN